MGQRLRRFGGATPGGSWEAIFATPDPRLKRAILGDYQGWVEHGSKPVLRRHLPNVMVPVIINLGPLWQVTSPALAGGKEVTIDSFLAGMHDRFATSYSSGNSCCIQVNFTPLGAYRLFGLPMAELTNTIVGFTELLGAEADRLITRLRENGDWAARFAILEDFLLRRLAAGREGRREIAFVLRQLEKSAGALPIGDLAATIGWSRKKLIHSFQRETGLAPKGIGRIYRLNRMLSLLHGIGQQSGDRVSLAELAHESGYYDQAHFNRDFRSFAGVTPGDYLAEIAPDVLRGPAN
ncbi:helix-turn-helix domain-containing protein [Dongia sp.]|uniref:helix-turn-helix domain-containing protein n=1 Tax=Dongia sp. TaxID=1977262 RepID=UPI0035B2C4D2